MDLLDKSYFDSIDSSINSCVPWFICSTWAILVDEDPIVTDSVYDNICKKLQNNWDEIEHPHKEYIDVDKLTVNDYPRGTGTMIKTLRKDIIMGLQS